jgi:hypothetical protein
MKSSKTNTKVQQKTTKSIKTLCSVQEVFDKLYNFGFKKIYIKALLGTEPKGTWDFYIKHYTVDHVIDSIINNIESEIIDEVVQNMRKPFRILFTEMFKDLKNHYSAIHMIQIIIEYGNGNYNPITTNSFMYKIDQINQWYEYKLNNNENEYMFFNAQDDIEVENAIKIYNNQVNYNLYYHATCWKSIQDILEDGPDSRIGRQCLDFGRTPSFYTTPDIKTAINWCQKRRINFQHECGIIIFALPIQKYDDYKIFDEPSDEWKTLVKNSRSCKKKNELDNMNFVYGPMLANIMEIKQDDSIAKTHNPIQWQLASKCKESDKILKNNMIGAIFIGKK